MFLPDTEVMAPLLTLQRCARHPVEPALHYLGGRRVGGKELGEPAQGRGHGVGHGV
jgi:hypothetical protein